MDFFQGNSPLNCIYFRLENEPPETETLSGVFFQSQSSTTGNVVPEAHVPASAVYSPQSATSEVDVNAYAEAMVQHM